MKSVKLSGNDLADIVHAPARHGHIPGTAEGWAVTARFGPGGVRWGGAGSCLRVVAVNPQRGTGTTTPARLDLLRGVLAMAGTDVPTVYLTAAGFCGCATPPGDSTTDLTWPGSLDLPRIDQEVGDLASRLPPESLLLVGVEPSWHDPDQRIWCYGGGDRTRRKNIVRAEADMVDRLLEVGEFRLLVFVCGELWDGGSGFDLATHTAGVDVVLDAAHASVGRWWDRAAEPSRRCAFQRTFRRLGRVCGGVLAQAHEAESGKESLRRKDNWVVCRGEWPFPDVEVAHIGD